MTKPYIVYNPDEPATVKQLIDDCVSLSLRHGNDITYRITYDNQSGSYVVKFYKDGKEIT